MYGARGGGGGGGEEEEEEEEGTRRSRIYMLSFELNGLLEYGL